MSYGTPSDDVSSEELTKEEFNVLSEHKNGVHQDNETYECPICRFEICKWRDEQMTTMKLVQEPQDARPQWADR